MSMYKVSILDEFECADASDILASIAARGALCSEDWSQGPYIPSSFPTSKAKRKEKIDIQKYNAGFGIHTALDKRVKIGVRAFKRPEKLTDVIYMGVECGHFYWEEISPNTVHVHCTDINCETHKRH